MLNNIVYLVLIGLIVIPSLALSDNNFSKDEQNAVKTLTEKGKITNLSVDDNEISYIREVCLSTGRSPEFRQRFTTCRDVEFQIIRDTLEVRSYGISGLLSGDPVVRLDGNITRIPTFSWDEYSITVRQELQRNFHRRERGSRTIFPVKHSDDLSKVASALRVLAK